VASTEIDLETLRSGFRGAGFIIDEPELQTVYLALRLDKPLLVTGPPGTGKTLLARALSRLLPGRLIRLQCHEGLDENNALYDWNIQRQLVQIHLAADSEGIDEQDLFSLANLMQRPLLQAITAADQVVLLIDELDRANPSFEAFLLEILSDFQISIPEIGTIRADRKPVVVITSDGERELSEALKRRCVYLYLDFPTIEQEASIIRAQIPGDLDDLNENLALAVAGARDNGFSFGLGGGRTLDWARALLLLNADHYQSDYVNKILAALAKNKDNLENMSDFLARKG
jgi:MoxR-like ATPase